MKKIAAIQMCSSDILDENLDKASHLIKCAALKGACVVVLPEMFPLMGKNPQDKLAIKERYGEGKIQSFLSYEAKANKVWIVGGTIPITSSEPEKVKAACLLYDDYGQVVARYDKIHLFDARLSRSN